MTYQPAGIKQPATTRPVPLRRIPASSAKRSQGYDRTVRADELLLGRRITIEEIRALNKAALKRAGTAHKEYYSGAGFEAYVMDKYGKRSRD